MEDQRVEERSEGGDVVESCEELGAGDTVED